MYGPYIRSGKCHLRKEIVDGQIESAWSYDTRLIQTVQDITGKDVRIGNITVYSRTTKHHQQQVDVTNCDVLVDNVPAGTQDLREPLLRQ